MAAKVNARVVTLIAAVLAVIAAVRLLPVVAWLEAFQAWAEGQGLLGMVVFALVYAASVVAFVPASILTVGAGAIYGLWPGTAVVVGGASLGAYLSFLLARGALRDRVRSWAEGNERFRALDGAVAREGGKIVFLVRLAPIFPFTYINYLFGLTGIRTGTYVVATVAGMIPGTIAYVYVGAAAAAAANREASATRTALQIAGAVASVLVTVVVARMAAKAIREAEGAPPPDATPPPGTDR